MEINITRVFVANTWELSGSRVTHGNNAGPETWGVAQAQAAADALLTTPEQIQALKDHVQATGFGEDVQAYSDVDCNALFLQLIAGDKRECGLDDIELDDEAAWADFEADDGLPHNIFRSGDQVYYELSA